MNRRTVLNVMLQSALVGSLLSPAAASAMVSPLMSTAVLDAPTVHEIAVRKARMLLGLGVEQKQSRERGEDVTAINAKVNAAFDDLLGFLLATFPGTTTAAAARAIFASGATLDVIDTVRLETMDDGLVPVAVMREICFRHKVRFQPEAVENWPEFMTRYKGAIVG